MISTEQVNTLTVDWSCADRAQLLHTHDHTCLDYRLDGPFNPYRDLAAVAWDAGIRAPGQYPVLIDPEAFVWDAPVIPAQAKPTGEDLAAEILNERCETYELPAFACAHCRNELSPQEEAAATAAARRAARNAPRPAGIPGICSRCRHPYGPKELVRPDRLGGFRPVCCWEYL